MAKTTSNPSTTIRLTFEVYTALNLAKRGYSFGEYIQLMLRYFQVTNIAPESCQTHPSAGLEKSIERIVKIQKAQEKDFFKLIPELKTLIENLRHSDKKTDFSSDDKYVGNELTVDELVGLTTTIEAQNKTITELKTQLAALQNELNLAKQTQPINNDIDKTAIKQIFEVLTEELKPTRLAPNYLQIPLSTFAALQKRLEQCL